MIDKGPTLMQEGVAIQRAGAIDSCKLAGCRKLNHSSDEGLTTDRADDLGQTDVSTTLARWSDMGIAVSNRFWILLSACSYQYWRSFAGVRLSALRLPFRRR